MYRRSGVRAPLRVFLQFNFFLHVVMIFVQVDNALKDQINISIWDYYGSLCYYRYTLDCFCVSYIFHCVYQLFLFN